MLWLAMIVCALSCRDGGTIYTNNKNYVIDNEKDTSIHLFVSDTLEVIVNAPIIPANWQYSNNDTTVAENVAHNRTSKDTGSYSESWMFLMKKMGQIKMAFSFIKQDSSIIRTFSVNIDVK